MNASLLHPHLRTLLRGEPDELAALLRQPPRLGLLMPFVIGIVAGCGAYGASIGLWRSPLLAFYVAVKMPLLVFLTLTVNGLINGMLAQVLGTGLSFRQTVQACLMCFATFGLIVGSLSPLVIGMVLDAPLPTDPGGDEWYRGFLLTHTAFIAFAGIVANHKLLRLIQAFTGSKQTARSTLIAWLAGNLFVGAQLSYNLRPFFGSPDLPVQFLREHPFDGNFYVVVYTLTMSAIGDNGMVFLGLFAAIAAVLSPFLLLIALARRRPSSPPLPPPFTP